MIPSSSTSWSAAAVDIVHRPAQALASATGRAALLRELAVVGLIVLLALTIRVLPMQRGFGFDELFTAVNFVGAESAWKTASTSINFNNHVGYSLLARLTEQAFGRSEWAIRLPALILGLATLPSLWWYARRVVSPMLALSTTLALALAPEHIRWCTTARGYTALLLGAILTSGLLFHLLKRPNPRIAAVYAVVTALATYCHLYMATVAAVQGLVLVAWMVIHRRERNRWRGALLGLGALVAAGALIVLLYLPILLSLVLEVQHAGRGELNPWFAWYTAIELLSLPWPWLLVIVLGLAGLGLWVVGRGRRPLDSWLAGYSTALIVAPLLAGTLARPLDLYPRFFLYTLPVMLAAVGVGLTWVTHQLSARLPSPVRPMAWAPVVACVVLVGTSWYALYPAAMTDEGFRAAAVALRAGGANRSAPCAFGAGAELFQWYSPEPLIVPKTVNELRQAFRGRSAPVCVYRPASWEGRGAAEIRAYLEERSTVTRYGDILLFRSRPGSSW